MSYLAFIIKGKVRHKDSAWFTASQNNYIPVSVAAKCCVLNYIINK